MGQENQLYIFAVFVLCGAALGLLYSVTHPVSARQGGYVADIGNKQNSGKSDFFDDGKSFDGIVDSVKPKRFAKLKKSVKSKQSGKFGKRRFLGSAIIFLEDFLTCIVALPCVFLLNLHVCNGKLHFYTLLGLVLGAVFYAKTLKCFIDKAVHWLYNVLTRLIKR